ncbi:MAG: hypothetical protein AAB400_00640 [Patescibacteria group bacterium]
MGFSGESHGAQKQNEVLRVPEKTLQRQQRLSDYVRRIEQAQQDFYRKQGIPRGREKNILETWMNIDTRIVAKGVNAALLALTGATAATWSFFKRGEYGYWGHSLAAAGIFFGLQLFGRKGMESIQYFIKIPSQKKSLHSLRGIMLQQQLASTETYSKISAGVREYQEEKYRIRQKAHPDVNGSPDRELQYEQLSFLRKRIHYIDELSKQHEELFSTMKEYHDLARLCEKKRAWAPLGFASAAALLAGVHASSELDMHALKSTGEKITHLFSTLFQQKGAHGSALDFKTSASLAPTLMALLMGWYLKVAEAKSEQEGAKDVRATLERIEEEIRGVQAYRARMVLKLSRLRKQLGLEITDEIEQVLEDEHQENGESPYGRWQKQFEDLIGTQFTEARREKGRQLPAVSESSLQFIPSLNQLLAVSMGESDRVPPSEDTTPSVAEQPPVRAPSSGNAMRAIKPLQPEQIVHSRKQTVIKQVIVDVLHIAGKEFDAHAQESLEQMPIQDVLRTVLPGTLQSLANDPSLSEETLDEIVRYFEELDENMTKSIAAFIFPREEDIASLRDVQSIMHNVDRGKKFQQAHEERQIALIRNVLMGSADAMRQFFLERYHCIDRGGTQEMTPAFFDESLRIWMRTSDRHDRMSLRKLLDICDREITSLAISEKQEKMDCIHRAIRILDSLDAENPFINTASFSHTDRLSLTALRRRALTPLADGFREMCSNPKFNKEILIQDILLGEWSAKDFDKKNQDRKTRYISGESFFEASWKEYPSPIMDYGLKKVESQYIIGSLVRHRDSWIPEAQKNDVIRLIRTVTDSPTPEAFDKLFFDQDGAEHIELLKFSGPMKRPIFFIQKGIECVAAAKVLGIPVIARVHEMRMPTFIDPIHPSTLSGDRHGTWNMLTNGKLLETDITSDFNIKNGEPTIVTIKQCVLSWLPWFSLTAIAQMCQQYEALYPGILDNLKTLDRRPIMKNALFTPQTLKSFLRKSS